MNTREQIFVLRTSNFLFFPTVLFVVVAVDHQWDADVFFFFLTDN